MCISSLSNGISNIYPTHSPSIPNISRGISHLSILIFNGIPDLICCPEIQTGSCIAIPICILAPGPASSAASDGMHRALNERGASPAVTRVHIPLPSRRRCGTWQGHSVAATNAARLPPMLRSRQLPASGAPGMGFDMADP